MSQQETEAPARCNGCGVRDGVIRCDFGHFCLTCQGGIYDAHHKAEVEIRGHLSGLREAAGLACSECLSGNVARLEDDPNPAYSHFDDSGSWFCYCEAHAINEQLAALAARAATTTEGEAR